MGFKSPTEPIVLSGKDCAWLERKLKSNNKRTRLTPTDKDLLEGSKKFDDVVLSFMR